MLDSVAEQTGEKGVPIRAISRGLSVLQAINRGHSISMMEISKTSKVPYPTACRIVQTLLHEGMIEREPARKRYRATALVQSLASGFQDGDELVSLARPHLVALCEKLLWPISITSRVGPHMMVRDSTHAMTSLTLTNYYPGFTLPLMECSTGQAYMAFCSAEQRDHILDGLKQIDGSAERMAGLLLANDILLQSIRTRGYATFARNLYTDTPGKTSSIAVPVFKDGEVAGAIALIFFAVSMPMERAVEQFVGPLKATAEAISAALSNPPAPD
jgi:IclR family transcriptional regulator, mhp operon transcriptional activator